MDGCPLGLGLVVEDKPTEFSCTRCCSLALWLAHAHLLHPVRARDLTNHLAQNSLVC